MNYINIDNILENSSLLQYIHTMGKTFYDISAENMQKELVKFDQYKGKVVIVVNTASKCGFTPQYEGLEQLYETYKDDGLVILGFPCNQFANQEPGDIESIKQGCLLNYGVTFPMFSKVDVNGKNAHEVFAFLTDALPGTLGKKVKWNFTKFVIGRDGKPLKRFAPKTKPEEMEPYLKELLGV